MAEPVRLGGPIRRIVTGNRLPASRGPIADLLLDRGLLLSEVVILHDCELEMSKKVFLYSDDAANKDARAAFKNKGYDLVPLTADKKEFWSGVENVENNGYFVLLSHGDKNGPLMVKGTEGSDMTDADIEKLCNILIGKKATFYCLSCHTGLDPFAVKMAKTSCQFVAPKGFAVVESSSAGVNVYSKEDGKYSGWSGSESLVPSRAAKALNIP